MNKKFLFFFILTLVVLSYIFSIDRDISKKLSVLNQNIRVVFINNMVHLQNSIFKYFDQVDTIKYLQNQLIQNEHYKALSKLRSNSQNQNSPINLEKINVISYINFNNFSKVLLNSQHPVTGVSALITQNGYSAGIAHIHNNQVIGYLNHHEKSNYAVFIGNSLAPGITSGTKNKELITIKFIPKWHYINIGDEVITSGMDNIFQKGVKVGKVVSIKELTDTKEAYVKPYANTYNKNYFYIYTNPNKDLNISN